MIFSLFFHFFQIGLFTFGGGYAMIPMITEKVIDNHWLTLEQLLDFIGIAESTPGVFAVNIATFVGAHQRGFLGAVFTTLGVILPSFILISIIARSFSSFQKNPTFKQIFHALKPTVLALIFSATLSIAFAVFYQNSSINWVGLGIFLLLFVLQKWKKIPTFLLLLLSGFLGIFLY